MFLYIRKHFLTFLFSPQNCKKLEYQQMSTKVICSTTSMMINILQNLYIRESANTSPNIYSYRYRYNKNRTGHLRVKNYTQKRCQHLRWSHRVGFVLRPRTCARHSEQPCSVAQMLNDCISPLIKDPMYSSKHDNVAKCKHQCESTIGSNIHIQPRAPTNAPKVSVMFINPLNEKKLANRIKANGEIAFRGRFINISQGLSSIMFLISPNEI